MSQSLQTYIVTDGGLRDEAAHVRQRHRAVPVDGGGERAGLAHRAGIAVGGGRQGKGTELSTA
jgi:hypothetical protein